MRATVSRGAGLLLLVAGTVCLSAGPRLEDDAKPKPAAKPSKEMPLPPGAVVAVYDSFLDALKMMPPRAFVLSSDKYKALMDEIDRLKKQLDRPGVRTPSRVALKGKIDGNLATLSAQFEFETETPGEAVRLGCGPAIATGVSLDGRTPRLRAASSRGREEDGFVVEIDKPGDHQLTLDLVLAVAPTAAGHGLALDLPRAAVTTLELELPAGTREVRVGGKPVADSLLALKDNKLSGGLGPAEKLELSWRGAGTAAAAAVLEAEGQVVIRIERRDGVTELTSEAKLALRVRAGQTSRWQLLVPPGSDVKVAPEDEARVAGIDADDQKQVSRRTIRLKEPGAAPLAVTVTHTQPAPKPGSGKAAPVGPFTVLDAARQGGSVLVANAVTDWHLEFTPHADLTRRAPTDEELKREPALVAAFRYGPGAAPRRGGPAWLDVESEALRGQVKTRSAHVLSLVADAADGPRWQVRTALTVTPRWADTDRLVVQLPEGAAFHEESSYPLPDRIRGLTYHAETRTAEFRLARGAAADTALTPFTVRVEAMYSSPVDLKTPGKAGLGLPRPLDTTEQDGTVTAQTPPGVELIAPAATPGLEPTRQTTHELAWRYPRQAPKKLDLAWQPFRPPVQVASLIDLTLLPGEAKVRHELRYQLSDARPPGPPRLPLRLPASIASRVRLREGGRLVENGGAAVAVPADARQPVLVLEYSVPLPPGKPGEPLPVPLVVPEQVTRGEARVRVWSDGGPLPSAAPGWAEQNIEIVPGRPQLPALVVRSDRADQLLTLELGRPDDASALVERTLARVRVAANGEQAYHVSYRLSRLGSRQLDLELPAPAATAGLEVKLADRLVNFEMVATDRPELRGRVVRLRLSPDLVQGPTVLDVTYRLDPGRAQATALTTPLLPPRLVGDAVGAPTRWLVTLPGTWVVLAPEPGPGTPVRWGLRGWLPGPRPAVGTADLDRWFAGGEARRGGDEVPSLVLWHDGPGGPTVTHAPRLAWQLACSLTLVLLGVAAWRLSMPATGGGATAAWLGLLSVIVAALVVVFLRPMLAAEVAYGCLPGLAVLVVLGGFQWMRHERYRRQIVFLPSFTRARPSSSLTRPESSRPAHGEPSTVDLPRTVGSSVERAG